MELLEGHNLRVALGREPRSPGEIVDIVAQCASALDHAHERGLVHRDIKPANIVVDRRGHVTLTDFGIARATDLSTMTGGLTGTPAYMSPEQALGQPVDGRSDVYSLGVTVYELLAGRLPFSDTSVPTLLYHHVHTPPPPLDSVRPELSAAVVSVVHRALAKHPEDRQQTAGELAKELRAAVQDQPVPQSGESGPSEIGTGRVSPTQLRVAPATELAGTAERATIPRPPPAHRPPVQDGPRRPRLPRSAALAVGVLVVGVIAVALASILRERESSQPSATSAAPATTTFTPATSGGTVSPPAAGPPTATAIQPPVTQPPADGQPTPPAPTPTPDPTIALLQEADAMLADDLHGAISRYSRVVGLEPDNAEALRKLGIALFYAQRSRDDIPRLESASRIDPGDATTWSFLTVAYFRAYDYERSAQAADRAASADPQLAETHAATAIRSLAHSDFAAAREQAGSALRAAPEREIVVWSHALVALFSGELDDSLGSARKLEAHRPRWALSHLLLCLVQRIRYELEDARRSCETAQALDPETLWGSKYLGWIDIARGRPDPAAQPFQAALQRNPEDAEAVDGLGFVALLRQDFPLAQSTFQRAIDLNARENGAHAGQGWVLLSTNQPAEAEPQFRRALEIFPADSSGWRGLGLSQANRGRWDLALESFERAVRVAPKDPENYEWVGPARLQLGRPAEARQALETAATLKPGDAAIQRDLAEARRRGG